MGRTRGLFEHRLEARFELAAHARASQQGTYIQAENAHHLQTGRYLFRSDGQRQSFDHGGLSDTGLTGEQGIVLSAAQQDVGHGANLVLAPNYRVKLPLAGQRREVGAILCQRRFAVLRRLQRTTGLAGQGIFQIGRGQRCLCVFPGAGNDERKFVPHLQRRHLLKAGRNTQQRAPQLRGLQQGSQQPGAAYACVIHGQAGKNPGPLNGRFDVVAEVVDASGAIGQLGQCNGQVFIDLRGVELVMGSDAVQVATGKLPQLMQPVHQLHIGVAAQFREGGRRLNGAKQLGVELAK